VASQDQRAVFAGTGKRRGRPHPKCRRLRRSPVQRICREPGPLVFVVRLEPSTRECQELRLQMSRDEPDLITGVGLHRDSDGAASHYCKGAAGVVHLDRLKIGREVEDVLGSGNRTGTKPGNTDASWIRVLGNASIPWAAVQLVDEVIKRSGIADLLDCKC